MKMPDVNILIYAHRNDSLHHDFYKSWLLELLNNSEPFALSPFVAVAFVRIVTNPSLSKMTTSLTAVIDVIDNILSCDNCYQPHAGKNHWQLVRTLYQQINTTGKLIGDIQHAALAIEHGCTSITRDADFKKFKPHGLRLELLQPN